MSKIGSELTYETQSLVRLFLLRHTRERLQYMICIERGRSKTSLHHL